MNRAAAVRPRARVVMAMASLLVAEAQTKSSSVIVGRVPLSTARILARSNACSHYPTLAFPRRICNAVSVTLKRSCCLQSKLSKSPVRGKTSASDPHIGHTVVVTLRCCQDPSPDTRAAHEPRILLRLLCTSILMLVALPAAAEQRIIQSGLTKPFPAWRCRRGLSRSSRYRTLDRNHHRQDVGARDHPRRAKPNSASVSSRRGDWSTRILPRVYQHRLLGLRRWGWGHHRGSQPLV
jgi:hypothetical protein